MATIANTFNNNFTGARTIADTADSVIRGSITDVCKLRPVPNEDVYFYTKRIDNSRVLRQADPKARARDWRFIGGVGFATAALITLLLPSAYGYISGYQLSSLQKEHQRLATERTHLEIEEARLMSAERLQELAAQQHFVDPAPDTTVYLPKNENSLALNRR